MKVMLEPSRSILRLLSIRRFVRNNIARIISYRCISTMADDDNTSKKIMNYIYVQHIEGKDMMTISFEYKSKDRIKSFNLYRKADESSFIALERIKANLQKLSKAKKSNKEAVKENESNDKLQLQLYRQDATSLDTIQTKNLEAWTEGSILKINEDDYIIKRNEPQVTIMRLPTPIMKGFIILPRLDVVNCDVKDCKFLWYRQISSHEREKLIEHEDYSSRIEFSQQGYWLYLSTGLTYSPSIEDVAHNIKVVCHPSKGDKIGPAYSYTSGRLVEMGPPECPFEKRHTLTQDRCLGKRSMRVVTYNLLADLYADSEYSRNVLFAHCPAHALEIDYRRQLLLKEIQGYNADIICLQEVDKKEFLKTYQPYFQLVTSHNGVYNTKGGQVAEGVATFFRQDRFELIESHRTILSQLIEPSVTQNSQRSESEDVMGDVVDDKINDRSTEESCIGSEQHPFLNDPDSIVTQRLLSSFDDIRLGMRTNPLLHKRFVDRHTILQTTLLRIKDLPENYIIVANTHLYFAPDADHVRLLQGSVSAKYLEFIKKYYKKSISSQSDINNPRIDIIFCGDMNSSPDCGLFKLLHEGKVDHNLPDWASNESETIDGITIETGLRFLSAYNSTPYTNYTPLFHGCLDYIYYESDGFCCQSVVPLPDHEDVTASGGIPSDVFPSDHLALIANLELKE